MLEEECSATLTGWSDGQRRRIPIPIHGPLRHKLGQGKPLGLGSCKIGIEKAQLSSGLGRYAPGGLAQARTLLEGDSLASWIDGKTGHWRSLATPTMTDFRKMAIFDDNDPRSFRYPSLQWFNSHSSIRLKPL